MIGTNLKLIVSSPEPIKYYCQCGAITIQIGEEESCCHSKNLDLLIPNHHQMAEDYSTIANPYTQCNHCVNNWGIDLCPCGCGAEVNRGESCRV